MRERFETASCLGVGVTSIEPLKLSVVVECSSLRGGAAGWVRPWQIVRARSGWKAADDPERGLAFRGAWFEVIDGWWVSARAGDHRAVEAAVGLAASAVVEPVALVGSGGGEAKQSTNTSPLGAGRPR